jgi:CheY-like chemotaxis protein
MRSNKRILLIEDNLIALFAARELLKHAGFTVDAACDGTDGVNLYRYYHYDLVLLDIGLPDINGFDVAKRIRKLEQEHHKTPVEIVALSATSDEYSPQRYEEAGINRVFNKPIRSDLLEPIFKDKNR